MSKLPSKRRLLAAIDIEEEVQHNGLTELMRLNISARRRVLANWCARVESLPLVDERGTVVAEAPAETEPPLIKFIHEHREETTEA